MIRKDFILQNYIGDGGKCDARAVRCHERIARWHAMSEHQLSHVPDFVTHQSQQNIAELGQTMKTLNQYYDDALGRSLTEEQGGGESKDCVQGCGSDIVMGKSPIDFDGTLLSNTEQSADVSSRIIGANGVASATRGTAEPEMRGLYILLTLNNEGGMEVLKYSARLCVARPAVFYSKPVQLALSIFQARKDHNYAKFFKLLKSPSTPYCECANLELLVPFSLLPEPCICFIMISVFVHHVQICRGNAKVCLAHNVEDIRSKTQDYGRSFL